jgi:hypothetical protein
MLDAVVIRPPGRHVRCARCQTTWYQEPALDLGAESMLRGPVEPVTDKARMLPPPSIRSTSLPRDHISQFEEDNQSGYRDRQRDLTRDLNRDLPREAGRDAGRDIGRDIARDFAREIPRDVTRDAPREVTREISRDSLRDMGRNLDRRETEIERGRDPEAGPGFQNADRRFETHDIDDELSRRERRNEREISKGKSSRWWVGIAAIMALVLGLGWVGDAYREQIVMAAPQTAGVYELFGYKVNARGLDFEGVTYAREIDNGVAVLAIRGQIVNLTNNELPVPKVKVTVRDADKRDLYQWTFVPETAKLTGKGRTAFATRLESPPPDAWDLEIRFAKAGE